MSVTVTTAPATPKPSHPRIVKRARAGRLDANGAARVTVDGVEYAVDGVIPGETVEFEARKKRRGKYRGALTRVVEASPSRVPPRCEYFGVCGGCALQHLDVDAQAALKEAELFARLQAAGVDVGDGDGDGTLHRHTRSPHHRHPRSLLSGGGDGAGDDVDDGAGIDVGDGAGDGDGDNDGDGAGDGNAAGEVTRLPAAHGAVWNYRRKARLGARFVPKKGGLLVGFRERGGGFITALQSCAVLDARLSRLLPALRDALGDLSIRESIPQVEVAAGDDQVALVLRHLQPLSAADASALKAFAATHGVQFYLQPGGIDSVALLWPEAPAETLFYRLREYDLRMQFAPTDFVQINARANDAMLKTALGLLQPAPGDSVLDLFCGIGNFTLPIARAGASVLGVEGDAGLVRRARQNAELNGIKNAEFAQMDLHFPPPPSPTQSPSPATSPGTPSPPSPTYSPSQSQLPSPLAGRRFDKILLDPPRSGAQAAIRELIPAAGPRVIVYISCNPVTLARDAAALTAAGYTPTHAGVIDMFAHTAQVESIARFER